MSRDFIIKSIKKHKPSVIPLPEIDESVFEEAIDLKALFIENCINVGGRVVETSSLKIDTELEKLFPDNQKIFAATDLSGLGNVKCTPVSDPHDLDDLDLAILEGSFGVAENGAIWISEKQMALRALPFIAKNLVIILPKINLFLHMHHAYNAINQRERNFGLFISGPSKTADIEQSLVIGAHGPMSLTIIMI